MERVVLVTGASSGIGRATAALLARSGYRVFGTSRQPAAPALDGFELVALDVTDDESVARCIETVLARAGRLDALVNNAGALHPGAVEEVEIDAARRLFETNFFGATRMIRAALPHLRASRGHIINISSGFGQVGVPFNGYYSASKHALEGLSESLRHEVAPLGVRVSIVEPGFFRSELNAPAGHSQPALDIYQPARDHAIDQFDRSVREGGHPLMVAQTILRILQTDAPRLRYVVGKDAQALLWGKRLAPYPLFEKGFRIGFRLDDWRDEARRVLPVVALAAGVFMMALRRKNRM